MADSKITALTAISTVDPTADPLVIVDVSDTSMAASGTTKKSTINQLLGAGGTATLASATITGDLTVDTNTLKVDSTNNRVGIGTASPAALVDVSGAKDATNMIVGAPLSTVGGVAFVNYSELLFKNTAGANSDASIRAYGNVWNAGGSQLALFTSNNGAVTERYRIDNTGIATWSNVGGVAGTAMTLNSTGLGVGGSPNAKLTVYGGGATTSTVNFSGGSAGSDNATIASNYNLNFQVDANNNVGGRAFIWRYGGKGYSDGTHLMTLDASGNLSVGATSPLNSVRIFAERSGGSVAGFNRTTSDGTNVLFYRQGSIVGDVSVTTTGTTFNSTSDYRLKEAVQPLVGGLARVSALKPSIYKWKSNGSSGEGFLAHELAEVVPAAVSGEKDAVNEDGSIKAQSIDMSRVVPILVAAIQELTARVQTLETR